MPDNRFPSTSWTNILRMRDPLTRRKALEALCTAYWFPVYAFVRRRAASADEAYDLTQGFFADLLGRDDLEKVDRELCKQFRSWLLACVSHYVIRERKRGRAKKRLPPGGLESLDAAAAEDRYLAETSHDLTAERLYDRAFAEALLARVLEQLREKYAAAGKLSRFQALEGAIKSGAAQRPYEEIAAELGMTMVAVRQAVFVLRGHYKELLHAEVALLVDGPEGEGGPDGPSAAAREAAVKDELRSLLEALDGS